MTDNLYAKLSEERKQLQDAGRYPEWYSTGAYQMFKEKYLFEAEDFKGQVTRIASTAAKHAYRLYGNEFQWEKEFFELFWQGDLSPSTPVLANMGTTRGFPVSCSGQYVDNSIDGFYSSIREAALLTKKGFGTSAYLGDIQGRGTTTSNGFKASGVVPVLDDFVTMARKVSQGPRRGAWAGYIEPTHPDFWEVAQYLRDNADDCNIGWNLTDEFKQLLDTGVDGDEADLRWKRLCGTKATFGKGYLFFIDKANRARPQWYVERNLYIRASNLCSEIMLHSSEEYTYTCVLSSLNVMNWDRIKDGNQAFFATIFLDCVAEEFITLADGLPGFEKAVAFTKAGRALGLGQCGFHSYLQEHMIPFESFDAHMLSNKIAKHIRTQAEAATRYMAERAGEPEWLKGTGRRNTHTIAIAPTKSTALLMGGISEGINPDPAMTYTQTTSAGEIDRVNPQLLKLMKAKGVYNKKHVQELIDAEGSVQNVNWLTPEEKLVYRTAFEINQSAILRMASTRQAIGVDQGQSLNLWFAADEDEAYISRILQEAWNDPNILAVYYIYGKAGVKASKDECLACQ